MARLSHRRQALEPRVQRLADGVDDEADLPELPDVDDVASIEDERRPLHSIKDPAVVERPELFPLREHAQPVRSLSGLIRVPRHAHLPRRVPQYLLLAHRRVVHAHMSPVSQQPPAHVDRRRLPRVGDALLEREPKHGHLLSGHRAEHGRHHAAHEPALLVLVHGHHLTPILGGLRQAVAVAGVRQAEDVPVESWPAEPHAGVEEGATPDAAVHGDGARHVRHVGADGLAQRRDGVRRRDPLRQERVCGELGELRRAEAGGGHDPVLGDPVRVHVHQRAHGVPVAAADEHAVRAEQVAHGGALGEELRVRHDMERGVVTFAAAVREEDPLHGLGGPDGDGGLLDDDLALALAVGGGARRGGGDHARRALPVGEVGGEAGAEAAGFGGGVDGDEDDVGVSDVAVDVGAEGEVAAAAGTDDGVEARLVDREAVAVPGIDAGAGDVDDGDLDGRALLRHDGHGRPADVAGADAADLLHHGALHARLPTSLAAVLLTVRPNHKRKTILSSEIYQPHGKQTENKIVKRNNTIMIITAKLTAPR
ncbi:hypothetical protein HU200_037420 [Digitaria exilis]|uniref:Uncharacterized protein n=1 Tax=Digitaria exilis TaxID=1010633 RepID=A0A835BDD8_9POAL|nr:hypothetical protein HU200_037420 [Digitaria exilis]